MDNHNRRTTLHPSKSVSHHLLGDQHSVTRMDFYVILVDQATVHKICKLGFKEYDTDFHKIGSFQICVIDMLDVSI